MGEYADEYVDRMIDGWCGGNGRGWGEPRRRSKKATPGSPLAAARMAAHRAFDPLWESGEMSRSAAYRWLAGQLRLSEKDTHMLNFDEATCRRVVEVCHARDFAKLAKKD